MREIQFKEILLYRKRKLAKFAIYIRGSLNKFPDFFLMGNFIDNTHMKL